MAIQVPVRSLGQGVRQDVATPEVNVRAASSVAEALGGLGEQSKAVAFTLLEKRKRDHTDKYLRESNEVFQTSFHNKNQEVIGNLDENGKDKDTGESWRDQMWAFSEGLTEQLNEKAPNPDAASDFKRGITPFQTKELLGIDLEEIELERKYAVKGVRKSTDNYSKQVLSVYNGQIDVADGYRKEIAKNVQAGVGVSYSPAQASALLEEGYNVLANHTAQSLVNAKDKRGLADILHGYLQTDEGKQIIAFHGVNGKVIESRRPTLHEQALTAPEKQKYLLDLLRLVKDDKKDNMDQLEARRRALQNTFAGSSGARLGGDVRLESDRLKQDFKNYRDANDEKASVLAAARMFATLNHAQKYSDFIASNKFASNDDVRQYLASVSDKAAAETRRDVLEMYPELGNSPVIQNMIDTTIKDMGNQYVQLRDSTVEQGGAADWVHANEASIGRVGDQINFEDLSQSFPIDGLINKTYAKEKSMDVAQGKMRGIKKAQYKQISDMLNYSLGRKDNGDTTAAILTNLRRRMPENYFNIQNEMHSLDPDIGMIMQIGNDTGGAAPNEKMQRVLFESANPDVQSKIKELDAETKQKISREIEGFNTGWLPAWVGGSEGKTIKEALKPTIFGSENTAMLLRRQAYAEKVAQYMVAIKGEKPSEAADQAMRLMFSDLEIIAEDDSNIVIPKAAIKGKYSIDEMKDLIERTNDVRAFPGPQTPQKLQEAYPEIYDTLKSRYPTWTRQQLYDKWARDSQPVWVSTKNGYAIMLKQTWAGIFDADNTLVNPTTRVLKVEQDGKWKPMTFRHDQIPALYNNIKANPKNKPLLKKGADAFEDFIRGPGTGENKGVRNPSSEKAGLSSEQVKMIEDASDVLKHLSSKNAISEPDHFAAVREASAMIKELSKKDVKIKMNEFVAVGEAKVLLTEMLKRKNFLPKEEAKEAQDALKSINEIEKKVEPLSEDDMMINEINRENREMSVEDYDVIMDTDMFKNMKGAK